MQPYLEQIYQMWNLNQNTINNFIQENAFENAVC